MLPTIPRNPAIWVTFHLMPCGVGLHRLWKGFTHKSGPSLTLTAWLSLAVGSRRSSHGQSKCPSWVAREDLTLQAKSQPSLAGNQGREEQLTLVMDGRRSTYLQSEGSSRLLGIRIILFPFCGYHGERFSVAQEQKLHNCKTSPAVLVRHFQHMCTQACKKWLMS